MTRPNILPGKREVSFSHGHAYIKRDGDIFATVTLGRNGHGMHAEGVHISIADEARAIAAVPALLEALEMLVKESGRSLADLDPDISGHKPLIAAYSALIAAGYQF